MLVVVILIAVVVAALAAVAFTRRRSHDDVHSVEGYHRQLHTLEHISVHPVETEGGTPAFPESALRVAGSLNVRVTDAGPTVVPPVPPPVVPDPDIPVTFDDAGSGSVIVPSASSPAASPSTGSTLPWRRDRAMDAMNRRPRRMAGPALAVAAVTALIVVLLLTGSHKVTPPHHGPAAAARQTGTHSKKAKHTHRTTTTTTTLPVISLPSATSLHSATYTVASSDYTLVLGATTGSCWVDAMDAGTDTTLFTGVLTPGEQHSITASGPVSVQVGAPTEFAGSVDGTAFVLPYGFLTPFTLVFQPAGTSAT